MKNITIYIDIFITLFYLCYKLNKFTKIIYFDI